VQRGQAIDVGAKDLGGRRGDNFELGSDHRLIFR
jgi:hypothetical protein